MLASPPYAEASYLPGCVLAKVVGGFLLYTCLHTALGFYRELRFLLIYKPGRLSFDALPARRLHLALIG